MYVLSAERKSKWKFRKKIILLECNHDVRRRKNESNQDKFNLVEWIVDGITR